MKTKSFVLTLLAVTLCFYGCESSSLDDEANTLPDEIIELPDLEDVDDVCTKMTDSNFIGYCYEDFDVNGDGKVSMAEAEAVMAISCSTAEDFTGIEYFTNLEFFESTSARILDLRYNAQLTSIYCEGAPIEKLDLRYCENLISIEEYAFRNCEELTSIYLPTSLKDIGKFAFCQCKGLTSIVLPPELTSIGKRAFDGCASCKMAITLSKNLTEIGNYAFKECANLTSIELSSDPASNECPPDSVKIGELAFSGCYGLISAELPNCVTSIGRCAFEGCKSLKSVVFPSRLTSIDDYGFSHCKNLTSVELPSGLTSIGIWAFELCESLTIVDLPSELVEIGGSAFGSCKCLETVVSRPISPPSIDEPYSAGPTFNGCSLLTTLYVPSESVEAYKDSDWAECFSEILPISE